MNFARFQFCLVWFATTLLPLAAQPQATPAPAAERFLVIVETSAPMLKRAENVQKMVGSLISSGMKGHIPAGSTIGLWTFNDKLFTGQLPLQLWSPTTRQRVALTMVQFLQQQKNEKPPKLMAAWEAATNIIAASDYITVLLITSGNESVVGTPFDAAIGESFTKNAEEQRKNNMPFLTILRAARGKVVAYAVNMPPWPLEVPEYPDEFKPLVRQEAPLVDTNPVVKAVAPPSPVVKHADPSVLSPTNVIYLAETAPAPVAVPIVAPTPAPEPTNLPIAAAALPVAASHPVEVVAAKSDPAPAAAAGAEVSRSKFPVVTILVAGISVLLAIMVVFIALLRWSRRSVDASLITRSMQDR